MKPRPPMKRWVALLLVLTLLLTSCSGGTAATTMKLARTTGTVGVSDEKGQDVTPAENLGLYSGYEVDTQSASYAWVNLDDVKLTKLDEDTEIEITKDGKKLEIEVKSGALFFNITEPLADDETLDIRSSTMMVGIRGTCGWVEVPDADHMNVYLLEGTVECTAGESSATVTAGEAARMSIADGQGTVTVTQIKAYDIPVFVLDELQAEPSLAEQIQQETGIDFSAQDGSVLVLTLPVTSKEISNSWSDDVNTIIVRPGDVDTLYASNDYYLLVDEDKTLILEEGVHLQIEDWASCVVNGTLETQEDVVNLNSLSIGENGQMNVYGRLVNDGGGSGISNQGSLFVRDGIESSGDFFSRGTVNAHLVFDGDNYLSLNGGQFTGGIILYQTTGATIAADVDSIIHYGGMMDHDSGNVDTIEQHGGHLSLGGGYIGELTIDDGDVMALLFSIGTLTQNGGDLTLNRGYVERFVLNGGQAYISTSSELGSMAHNGGELRQERG